MKVKKHQNVFSISQNSVKNEGNGVVKFTKPLVITDDSEQRNGTRYEIKSMDISEYHNELTINHSMAVEDIVGKTFGITKGTKKITIDGIEFAVKENAKAIFAYNMILGGFIKDFSIETIGPWPDDDGIYHDSKLIGLSAVVKGNNKSATLNQIVKNSIHQAKECGLDADCIKNEYLDIDKDTKICDKKTMNKMKILNNRDFSVLVNYQKANGEKVEKMLAPNGFISVDKKYSSDIEAQIKNAVAPAKEDNSVAEAVKSAIAPLMSKVNELETKIENKAAEPSFHVVKVATELNGMDYRERHGKQINHAWDMLKGNSVDAAKKLEEINNYHIEKLKEAGIVSNTVTISDFGNFVISPELLKEIEGVRSDYSGLLSKLDFKETLSLQMAWLKRSGDISMTEVETCDDGADGNLKPISEYSAGINYSNLHELAAVTPVCNAATRFLAADLLGDVAAGYRNDFDRKKAQLYIARLQQAVDSTGNVGVYSTTTDAGALKSWISMVASVSDNINNGVFILSNKSRWELIKTAIGSGISGDILGIVKSGDLTPILGSPAIIVPNDLLPTLNTAETKTFTVEGVAVSITHAIFYTELSTFTGRTSGGLQYDLSTEAAYEDASVVKSAFQRNELVLRGSFFRGGAIRDEDKVAALGAAGLS